MLSCSCHFERAKRSESRNPRRCIAEDVKTEQLGWLLVMIRRLWQADGLRFLGCARNDMYPVVLAIRILHTPVSPAGERYREGGLPRLDQCRLSENSHPLRWPLTRPRAVRTIAARAAPHPGLAARACTHNKQGRKTVMKGRLFFGIVVVIVECCCCSWH